jgi:hypothetical protein
MVVPQPVLILLIARLAPLPGTTEFRRIQIPGSDRIITELLVFGFDAVSSRERVSASLEKTL